MKLSELLSAYSIETGFSNDFEVHALAELNKVRLMILAILTKRVTLNF